MQTTNNTIDTAQDVIDSRDVIDRIRALENEQAALIEDRDEAEREGTRDEYRAAVNALKEWDECEGIELDALRALAGDASDYAPDWEHGAQLIRDTYFREYAEELAEDIGAIDRDAPWPINCIDWDEAARQLQMDYTAVDFNGVRYWVR